MSLLDWLRATRGDARTGPRNDGGSTPLATTALAVEAFDLTLAALATAWHPERKRLVLTTSRPVSARERVVVKVSTPSDVTIPLTGTVVESALTEAGVRVEIDVDEDRRLAVARLLALLEGRAEAPKVRAPRFALKLPVVVSSSGANIYMSTFSVSQGGCGLLWSGLPPAGGTPVHLRLGSGTLSAAFVARVCWVKRHGLGVRVGVRFAVGQEGRLSALLLEAGRGSLAL